MVYHAVVSADDPYAAPAFDPATLEPPRLTQVLLFQYHRGARLANLAAADLTDDGWLLPPLGWAKQILRLRESEAIVRQFAARGTVAATGPPPVQETAVAITRDVFQRHRGSINHDADTMIGRALADFDDSLFLGGLFGDDLPADRDVATEKITLDALRDMVGLLHPRDFASVVWIMSPAAWLDHVLRLPDAGGLVGQAEMTLLGRPVYLSLFAPAPAKGNAVALLGNLSEFETVDSSIVSSDGYHKMPFAIKTDVDDDGNAMVLLRVRTAGRVKDSGAFARLKLK